MIGQTVLHYNIIEKLGEGGMGVVYKAEDTTLHRTVALKFLPDKASGSAQDKARFLVEARAAANLNHPNICTIHAIEEFEGKTFIAMECVEGVTLNEKIPFKMLNAALDAAIQMGDALSEAHSKGIVHRDVKSENIMITPKGQVKVMDFGLAKLKGSLKLTRTSSTVGTLGYMSPEQIQGGDVDHRSDIFSLGVVFFEMITGQLPFRGEHEAAMVYSIANEQPKRVTDLLPDAPAALEEIFAKAFEKDPNERYQSAADFAVDLKRLKKQSSQSRSRSTMPAYGGTGAGAAVGAATGGSGAAGGAPGKRRKSPGSRATMIALVTLLAGALGYIGYLKGYVKVWSGVTGTIPTVSVTRLTEQAGAETAPDISPDGNYIAYQKGPDIFVQRAGGGNAQNLTASSGSSNSHPAYSPNGEFIAFNSDRDGGGIFLMGSTGESARRLTDFGKNPSWSPDGKSVVFATEEIVHPFSRGSESKLWTIDISTGEKTLLYDGDGVQPRWSPEGGWIAFWGLPRTTGKREIYAIRASGGEAVRLTDDDAIDWNPVWSADGKAIYFLSDRGGTMNVWRLDFNPGSGTTAGKPVPVIVPSQNCTGLTISMDGSKLIYVSSEIRGNIFRIGFDPARLRTVGTPSPVTEGSREFDYLSVSPDGRSLAFTIVGVQEDIGIIGTDGTGFRKLTNDRPKDRGPSWSPDGRQLAIYSERGGPYQIWTINTDGSGTRKITDEKNATIVSLPIWPPGSRALYYQVEPSGAMIDLPAAPGGSTGTARYLPAYSEELNFAGTSFSPDGRALAGSIGYPDGTNRGILLFSFEDSSYTKVIDSGKRPLWLANGRTILYLDNGRVKLVEIETGKVTVPDGIPDLTRDELLAISPDNRTIYFVRTEVESDIWQASLD